MKNVQLKKLELTNYRNIEHAEYEFDGNSKIIGDNRTGKTNTLEAIYFLLCDKLLDCSSDLPQIKPLKDLKAEVRVKGTFEIFDESNPQIPPKEITIEKKYGEKWVKTRGSSEREFKGHYSDYVYNGANQGTYKEYFRLFCEDFGLVDSNSKIDYTQLLINPFYIGNLGESSDWTHLRNFIIKLVGDVSDEDVVNRDPTLSVVISDINKSNGRVDQVKKIYSSSIEKAKETIISDDAQIELLEATNRPTDEDIAVAKEAIEKHEANISNLRSNVGVDSASLLIQEKINAKKSEVNKLVEEDLSKTEENSEKKMLQSKLNEEYEEQSELISQRGNLIAKKQSEQLSLENLKNKINEHSVIRNNLISKVKDIDLKLANPENYIETECPTCHRRYSDEEIAERSSNIKERLTAERNDVILKGKENTSRKNDLELKLVEINNKISSIETEIKNIEEKQKNASVRIEKLTESIQAVKVERTENPQIAVVKNEIAELELKLKESRESFSKGVSNNNEMILEEQQAMEPYKKVISDYDYYLRQQEKLESVKQSKEKHTTELTDLEQKKELLNKFIYTKLKMLDENVSKVFGNIKFQLIKENIKEGSFDAVCKPYIYDIEKDCSTDTTWKSGSKSERVITGIAIIEAIKKAINLPNLPILFDEGGEISTETFNTKFKTNSQLICVKVVDNIQHPMVQPIR